jgi:ribulose bisphosphate carboxylase small subunit
MLLREDLLTNAKQSVERGREIVDRQRVVVHNMERAGLDTEPNKDVLRTFERLLAKFEDEYARLSRL